MPDPNIWRTWSKNPNRGSHAICLNSESYRSKDTEDWPGVPPGTQSLALQSLHSFQQATLQLPAGLSINTDPRRGKEDAGVWLEPRVSSQYLEGPKPRIGTWINADMSLKMPESTMKILKLFQMALFKPLNQVPEAMNLL